MVLGVCEAVADDIESVAFLVGERRRGSVQECLIAKIVVDFKAHPLDV